MGDKADPADLVIARAAARQHGVVTHRQLRDAGLSRAAITKRAQGGRLHRLYQGVYAVGHVGLSIEGRWMAAVLACGSGAVLSHGDAAALWGLLRSIAGPVDVSVPTHAGRVSRTGIRLHRRAALDPAQITIRRNIPVTTPERAVADLDGVVAPHLVRRAIRQAEVLGLPLGPRAQTDGTRSELERLFLGLCRRYRLPPPQVNAKIGSLTVDFLWPERRLVVETDGYRYHRGRQAFEDDRARDLQLRALGYEVIRLSYKQALEEPERVARTLAVVLQAAP